MTGIESRVWVKTGLTWPTPTDRDRDVCDAELGLRARACQDTENTGDPELRQAWITQLPDWGQR